MADHTLQCVKNVVLEVTRDDGEITRSRLQRDLVLRKEVGNARLVSGDTVIWVGKSIISHKDSTLDSGPTRTVRVENGKRRFVFTIPLDATGNHFYSELKHQVEGVAIRKKKRKIRKQLSQITDIASVDTLDSPEIKLSPLPPSPTPKLNMTPKRSPLTDIGTSQPTLPSPLPMTMQGLSTSLTSPLRSPFRSPFRKKPRLSQSPSSGQKLLQIIDKTPPLSSSRVWNSPARPLKLWDGPTPPNLKHKTSNTPEVEKKNSEGGKSRRKSVTGSINRRVRSLQLILGDETSIKNAEAQAQKKITSHFLQMSPPPSFIDRTARELNMSMAENSEQLENKVEKTIESSSDLPGNGTRRYTHGLLNLGNYCYMNAIVQALAALPEYVSAVQDEENLLKVIRKQPCHGVKTKTMEQLKTIFNLWRTSGDTKRLPLQCTLSQILQHVVRGGDTLMNPEPLKNVMGEKYPIFATHFQQDAHEFLLNLVSEYEQELVQMVHEITAKIQEEDKLFPQVQKSCLLNFFRHGPKAEEYDLSGKSSEADSELVSRLPPAKCFRAEFNRTLTCQKCGFSRKQTETFYDFSLDLPYNHTTEPEPTAEKEPQTPLSPEEQCFCNFTPVTVGEGNTCHLCCPKASCSYREKVGEVVSSTQSPAKFSDGVENATVSPSIRTPAWAPQPPHIKLETLIQKQFETEVLELMCEQCKEGKAAESAYQIKSLPSILVFHLKRFEVNAQSGALFKRCDSIVPPAAIDMTKFVNYSAPTEHDLRYNLKSVIHHLGKTIDEGHYVADVCDANGQWIRRNDTHESMISEDYALHAHRSQESCYMFFYVKLEKSTASSGKENVPANSLHQDENVTNSSQRRQISSSKELRAFL